MKGYDYWSDAWPQIVSDCFTHGGSMFAVTERRDGAGGIVYEQGRELDEQQALEFRGETMAVYDNGKEQNG